MTQPQQLLQGGAPQPQPQEIGVPSMGDARVFYLPFAVRPGT